MKKLFLLAVGFAIALSSCQQAATTVDVKKATTDLLNTDKAWNDLTQKVGFPKSSESYYADSVISIVSGETPLMGLDAVKKHHESNPDSGKLSWIPMKAEVAQSGDLGYTYGNWQYTGKTKAGTDTTVYGVYSDIWKKQADGSWKAVLDHGSDTPKP